MSYSNQHLLIGKVSGIFGIQGWVKVFSYCDPIENICSYSPWYMHHQEILESVEVISKKQGKTIIAKFPNINAPEEARKILGDEIYIHHCQLPELVDSYYYFQLVGLTVIGQNDYDFGKVEYTFDTGSNSVIVVKHTSGSQYYIPLIKPYLLEVNLARKFIKVDWDKDWYYTNTKNNDTNDKK